MAEILKVDPRRYAERETVDLETAPVPTGTGTMRLAISRDGLPDGHIGSIGVVYPDGSEGPSITFEGGPLFTDATGKKLSKTARGGVDIPVTETYLEFALQEGSADGKLVPKDLPAGRYRLKADFRQEIDAAIKVDIGERQAAIKTGRG